MVSKTEASEMIAPEITSAIIADKCRVDAAFAKDLKSEPVASLESKLDISLKDSGVDIRVTQNTPEQVHVALPHYKNMEEMSNYHQMTEEEMAQIAGGEVFIAVIVTVAVVVVGGALFGIGLWAGLETRKEQLHGGNVASGDDTI